MTSAATKKTTRRNPTKTTSPPRARAGAARAKKPTSIVGHHLPGIGNTAGEDWHHRLANHRRRQASVSSILDQTFGQLATCSPELWERRAYLMLVGLVYERLALHEDEISTEELISLSKALAENRRVELNQRKLRQDDDTLEADASGDGKLPKHFADSVRQVYGLEVEEHKKKVERAGKPNSVPP